MSHQSNTDLLEIAAEHISYWEGEGIGATLEADIERNDLRALEEHILESAKIMWNLEHQRDDPMTDERAEAMYTESEDVY